jgi:guanylate kinase
MRKGLLFVVSAPSGTGKTTLVEKLVQRVPDVVMSRSYTSRAPRPSEINGVDYNFIDEKRFSSMVSAGQFLEWANVFGHRYGTAASDTDREQRQGRDVVLVIDVQGARQIREREVDVITIFVLPPSFRELETRLRQRSGTNVTEMKLRQRLETAREEVAESTDYDYLVVNEDVDHCVSRLQSIVISERLKTAVVDAHVTDIVAAFRPSDS